MSVNPAWQRRREAARKYRPKRIRLLLVAESPPAEPERYFYFEAPESRDELFDGVCEVLFEAAPAGDKAPYLKELRRRGVFVVELKPDAPRAKEPLAPYVAPFAINLYELAAERVVLVSADVYAAAHAALAKERQPVVDVRVPAPSAKSAVEFRRTLRQALVRAELEKLIRAWPVKAKETKAKSEA